MHGVMTSFTNNTQCTVIRYTKRILSDVSNTLVITQFVTYTNHVSTDY